MSKRAETDTPRISPERLLGSIFNGVVAIDRRSVIIFFNRTAAGIFSIPEGEAVGKPILEVLPNTGGALIECMNKGTEFPGFELKGMEVTLVANISPIFTDSKIVGAISVFQEISQIEKMVKDLHMYKSVNRQLDAIVESSFDGLFITDGQGTILRCNKSSEKLVGHRNEDIVGKNIRELLKMGYIDHSVTLEVLEKRASVTILQRLKDGKQILVTGTPVVDETETIEFVVTNERDISHLNIMRHQLQETRPPLHHPRKRTTPLGAEGPGSSRIVAVDPKMRQVLETASIASRFDTTVLLSGESGVGKGIVARYIHESSKRAKGAFVKINCGAIPGSLIESELFGYRKGAFTGASVTGKAGLIEMADGGSLFLDEIGELSLSAQVKFLRVLEDKHITPVGGVQTKNVNVRVIAATNRDLRDMVSDNTFREDLFFRLNVIPINIPPLRERKDDIPVLIYHFLHELNARFGTNKRMTLEAVDILCTYSFPGNVRELANLVERLIILCPEDEIKSEHLPQRKLSRELRSDPLDLIRGGMTLRQVLDRIEQEVIMRALQQYGSKRKAARVLGLNSSTVIRKARKHRSTVPGVILH